MQAVDSLRYPAVASVAGGVVCTLTSFNYYIVMIIRLPTLSSIDMNLEDVSRCYP